MVAWCRLDGCLVQALKDEWLQYKKVENKQEPQTCIAGCVGLYKLSAGSGRNHRASRHDDRGCNPAVTGLTRTTDTPFELKREQPRKVK